MLKSINYASETANLGKIVRKGMGEISYFSDELYKVFSSTISNFDAITTSMQQILYMLLTNKNYDFSSIVIYELAVKLGSHNIRNKNIYYARYFILLANHVSKDLVIEN